MKFNGTILCLVLLITGLPSQMRATVTNAAWYRLGENDPGAASGLAVTNTTADIIGTNHLKQFSSPLYTNAVSTNAANTVGSSLAVQFNGTSQYLSNTIVSLATNNFGIEAWVKPASSNANYQFIAYNGNSGTDGWGLFWRNGRFNVWFGNVAQFASGTMATGVWAHVALVRDNGNSTLYVNGVDASGALVFNPIAPTGRFTVGGNPNRPIGDYFNGAVDEVRVFTFGAGQFSTNDFLLNLQRVTTLPATAIGSTNATLNGAANPAGLATSVWFEWGTTTNYGNVTPAQASGSGGNNTNFSQLISGLFGNFTYYFRATASNSVGIMFGTNQSFTVPFLFTDIGAGLPAVWDGSVAWGDYDNDGRLDILLTGATSREAATGVPLAPISQVWRNTGNGFTNIGAGLPGIFHGSATWGDYDNDGRLDILLVGAGIAQVWRNTGNGFTNINAGLPGVSYACAAWGDYDNDGRPDILLSGFDNDGPICEVWRNTSNGFVNTYPISPGVGAGSVAWGDYDNDGRLDILLTGQSSKSGPLGLTAQVLRNTGSGFTNINAGLPGVYYSAVAWGDYDNDGRLDILLTGATNDLMSLGFIGTAQVWRNTGSGFTNINAGLPGVYFGSAAWADYDNDGRLDVLLTGATNATGSFLTQLWRNTGTGFTNINLGLQGAYASSTAWGDYDSDGRLEILLSGSTNASSGLFAGITRILRHNGIATNTPPTIPTGLTATAAGTGVSLNWNMATDGQTPAVGLTYSVRAGTSPGGSDLINPMADSTGNRRLPSVGYHQGRAFQPPFDQPIYWSVQSVDTAFAGSPFAAETSFRLNSPFTSAASGPILGDSNGDGIVSQPEFAAVLANLNGNGIVSQSELDLVLANYFPNGPFLQMTNVAGLGGTNVTFALTNSLAGAFSVEYSTNLTNWQLLGPATPRYLFTDTNAPAVPQRYYRLRWP